MKVQNISECLSSSELQNILLPNLVWLCSIISQSVMQKNWFTVFNVKVIARAYVIKIWLFLLYLLKCWLVCNQTWFDSTASVVQLHTLECPVENGITALRSRSQQRFKMSVNVCPDDIFWIREHIVTKLAYHEPECHAERGRGAVFKVKVTGVAHMIKIWLFLLYFLNCWFLGNQAWSDDNHHELECLVKKLDYCIQGQGHSKGSKC